MQIPEKLLGFATMLRLSGNVWYTQLSSAIFKQKKMSLLHFGRTAFDKFQMSCFEISGTSLSLSLSLLIFKFA